MGYSLEQLYSLRESEDKVEFKSAQHNFSFAGSEHREQAERRKCFLGYVIALCNEGGGTLVLGMADEPPHTIVGTDFAENKIGNLEDEVYSRLGIRIHIHELYNEIKLRVLVTDIPSRPKGRILKFEGISLMRTGESLRNMSDEEMFAILSEQESDFSATFCNGISIEDLDKKAILVLKEKYSEKQKNETFTNQTDEQALIDLGLLKNKRITYAALILLGKEDKIKEYLPQSAINLEYRENADKIQFDKRTIFAGPYFIILDELWKIIDVRNKNISIQNGSYITDIPELNYEIIRESINNAIAHRDYTKTSEILIKQSKGEFLVQSHGGFPLGVTKENILTINSTPRNRLLADILTKTGLVERSGQGVDKIFYQNLSDGKGFPSYEKSDLFQVTLTIPTTVLDTAFNIFFKDIQKKLSSSEKLGVHHVIALVNIRDNADISLTDASVIERLLELNVIRKKKDTYLLSEDYYNITKEIEGSDSEKIVEFIKKTGKVKMHEIIAIFNKRLNRRQVNNLVFNLVDEKILDKEGKGFATLYYYKGRK
jgi:ATP-dependent DNA helicase RecG